jgi:hypothetical protein
MDDSEARLLAALQFLMTSDMPSEHRSVLIETVTHALREHETTARRGQAAVRPSAEWQVHETAELSSYLTGRVANSWQQADEIALRLAAQLHRHPLDIRAKAVELGFGVAVDFRLAKAQVRAGRE